MTRSPSDGVVEPITLGLGGYETKGDRSTQVAEVAAKFSLSPGAIYRAIDPNRSR